MAHSELQAATLSLRGKGLALEAFEPRMRPEEKSMGSRKPWRA